MPGFVINGTGGPAITIPNSGDWLRSNRFVLTSFFGKAPSSNGFGYLYALKSVQLPSKVIKELEIEGLGTTYKFAKSVSYDDLKMTFYGCWELLDYLYGISNKIHTEETGISDFDIYKGIIELVMYETNKIAINFKYVGAWINNIDHGQVSYGSSEIQEITVNIKYDYYIKDTGEK